jgi:hypothetical protein
VNDKVRNFELERKLAAERRRNKELEEKLENSRRWSRAWKRAAKSELDVLSVIRNLRQRRSSVGIDGYAAVSRGEFEEVLQKLENAQLQIEFLERERQRWMENAEFFKLNNHRLHLRLANLENHPQNEPGQDGRA